MSRFKEYRCSYFDIDDILAEEECVPTTFRQRGPNLGYINNDDGDIEEGTEVELPLWMSSSLHTRQFVFVSLPKFMRLKARGNLNADAATVNLSVQSPFFYEMALEAIRMMVDLDSDLAGLIAKVIQVRFKSILDKSQNTAGIDFTDFTRLLTESERTLFSRSNATFAEVSSWKNRTLPTISASAMAGAKRRKTTQ